MERRTAIPVSYPRNRIAIMGDKGEATYTFSISSAGTYDIAVRLCYPFGTRTAFTFQLTGRRRISPRRGSGGRTGEAPSGLHCGRHFIICRNTHHHSVGRCEGRAVLRVPRLLVIQRGAVSRERVVHLVSAPLHRRGRKPVSARQGFQLTTEILRRKPDSALVWYEDFEDYGMLDTGYWQTLSGSWKVWRSDEYSESRVYSQLDGSGQFAWNYEGFRDIHLRARLAFPAGSTGKAGVFCGSLSALNYNSQAGAVERQHQARKLQPEHQSDGIFQPEN